MPLICECEAANLEPPKLDKLALLAPPPVPVVAGSPSKTLQSSRWIKGSPEPLSARAIERYQAAGTPCFDQTMLKPNGAEATLSFKVGHSRYAKINFTK